MSASEPMVNTMKKIIITMAAALLGAGLWIHPASAAVAISIGIGDRPYYDGPAYWESGYEWVFVPGYQSGPKWVHGHYERRGDFRAEHAKDHHKHRHHNDQH